MANIEEALFARLSTFAGLTALIGTKIFPLRAPDDFSAPFVIYQKITGKREQSHEGDSSLVHPRIQYSCWGINYGSAKLVSRQVVKALHAFKGVVSGVDIQFVEVDSEVDTFDEDTKLYRVLVDVIVWHREVIT